jgi:ABC-2 type transport system permease protein
MMWNNVLAVVRREYLQRVRSKWFLIATIGGPVFMIGVTVVPIYFAERGQQEARNIAIVDGTDVLYERVAPGFEAAGYTVHSVPWSADVMSGLRQQATDGDLGGFLMLDELTLQTGEATLYATDRPSAIRRISLESTVTRSALEYQLEQQGIDAASLLSGGDLRIEMLQEDGAGAGEPQFMVAYIGAFFLYMVILLYSVAVMRATLEEKTSRVVEVIISSMKPWHLLLGKIVGVGAVGLTQMGVWLLSGALITSAGIPMLIASRPDVSGLDEIQGLLPGFGMLTLFMGFFILGFFMFSSLYAAVGAMCSTDEEAQQAQVPVMMFLIIPIMFVMNVIQNPMTPLSTGLSLFPLFSPVLMWSRVASGASVPAWQVALSFVLMIGAVFAIAWVAGRIYKVGILMAGKRPTVPELWRWVREA